MSVVPLEGGGDQPGHPTDLREMRTGIGKKAEHQEIFLSAALFSPCVGMGCVSTSPDERETEHERGENGRSDETSFLPLNSPRGNVEYN